MQTMLGEPGRARAIKTHERQLLLGDSIFKLHQRLSVQKTPIKYQRFLIQDHVRVVLLQNGHHLRLHPPHHQPLFHPLPHRILHIIPHQPSPALIILLQGVVEDELDIGGEHRRSLIVQPPSEISPHCAKIYGLLHGLVVVGMAHPDGVHTRSEPRGAACFAHLDDHLEALVHHPSVQLLLRLQRTRCRFFLVPGPTLGTGPLHLPRVQRHLTLPVVTTAFGWLRACAICMIRYMICD
ncbi:hypothetical protein DsansV1_C08g0078021 [Dioscorea sansibarensis]